MYAELWCAGINRHEVVQFGNRPVRRAAALPVRIGRCSITTRQRWPSQLRAATCTSCITTARSGNGPAWRAPAVPVPGGPCSTATRSPRRSSPGEATSTNYTAGNKHKGGWRAGNFARSRLSGGARRDWDGAEAAPIARRLFTPARTTPDPLLPRRPAQRGRPSARHPPPG